MDPDEAAGTANGSGHEKGQMGDLSLFRGGRGREEKEKRMEGEGKGEKKSDWAALRLYGMHGVPTPNGRGSDCSLVALPRKCTYYHTSLQRWKRTQ